MFIFREKSGFAVGHRDQRERSPQKVGQRVNLGSLETHSCLPSCWDRFSTDTRADMGSKAGPCPSHTSTPTSGPPVHHLTAARSPIPCFTCPGPQCPSCETVPLGSHRHASHIQVWGRGLRLLTHPGQTPPGSSRLCALGKALRPEAWPSWMRSVLR